MRLLTLVEALWVASFVALAALSTRETAPETPPIEIAALAAGPTDEQWMGIYFQGQHVGYAVSREAPTADGGRVYQQQSAFKLAAMGEVQHILLAGAAETDAGGRVERFDFLLSSPAKVIGRGTVSEHAIHLELSNSGESQEMDIAITERPVLSQTISGVLRGRTLTPGDSFTVPYFDPVTMANAPATLTIEAPEVLPNGEPGYWIRTKMGGVESRRLVDAGGSTLREESAMGLSAVRMTQAEAMAVDDADPPDLVALAAVPNRGGVEPRGARVSMRVSGVDPALIPSEPPLQTVSGDIVDVSVPLLAELPDWPVRDDAAPPDEIEASVSLPAGHPEIVARAAAVVGDAPTRLEAARRLYDFVFTYVQKVPTIGLPNGLEVLRSGRGDCNEHTALYVSLARAAGIPARIAAGLVYSTRMGDAFYYHAWPEVRLGPAQADGRARWVPIDPTLGQLPADGSHLKIATGDLDRQIEIMGLMGRIRLEVLEMR